MKFSGILLSLALASTLVLGGAGMVAAPAQAATKPGKPGNVKVVAGSSTARVTWSATKGASYYRVCLSVSASTYKCARSSPKSRSRSVTFTRLKPTGGTDYLVRVYAYRGSAYTGSNRARLDLYVSRTAGVHPVAWSTNSVKIAWSRATNAGTYQVQIATNLGMTHNVRRATTRSLSYRFSGLSPARTYYFRIRGLNGNRIGVYSYRNLRRLASAPAAVSLVTYNLCGQNHCRNGSGAKHDDGTYKINPWSTRGSYAGTLARRTAPMIVSTQESGGDTNFGAYLGSSYALAVRKSAKSLFYRPAYLTLRKASYITLRKDPGRYAVFAEFLHRATNTRFMVIDPHLTPYKGSDNDRLRAQEMTYLLNGAERVNTSNLPVVFAGDFNSNSDNANTDKYDPDSFDAAQQAMDAALLPEITTLTSNRPRWSLNSYNGGARDLDRRNGDHIDRIFVDHGGLGGRVTAQQAEIVADIVAGGFYKQPFASDHNPVAAKLTIPGFPARS